MDLVGGEGRGVLRLAGSEARPRAGAFAHAYQRTKAGDDVWVLCSSDKASIRAAVRIAIAGKLKSLEAMRSAVGARPKQPLKAHHQELFLSKYRTEYLLGG